MLSDLSTSSTLLSLLSNTSPPQIISVRGQFWFWLFPRMRLQRVLALRLGFFQPQKQDQRPSGTTRNGFGLMPDFCIHEHAIPGLHGIDKLLLWLAIPDVQGTSFERLISRQRQDDRAIHIGTILRRQVQPALEKDRRLFKKRT